VKEAAVDDPVRVLVVDDDPDVRDLLDDYLSGQGYSVLAADGAAAARALLEAGAPDLVLLDVGLPGEDGLSLARHIRERLDIGIIMISGAGETLDRIVGLEVGADDYVAKPFDPRELKARLKSVLRRYQRASRPEHQATPEPPQSPSNRRVAVGSLRPGPRQPPALRRPRGARSP
jgi:DNA-binding response OmpR family regulator